MREVLNNIPLKDPFNEYYLAAFIFSNDLFILCISVSLLLLEKNN